MEDPGQVEPVALLQVDVRPYRQLIESLVVFRGQFSHLTLKSSIAEVFVIELVAK